MKFALRITRLEAFRVGMAVVAFTSLWEGQAQPIISSTVPANGAANVSPSAPVVVTFSDPMNTEPDATYAMFMHGATFEPIPTVTTWNNDGTIMTNIAMPAFPAGTISWYVMGEDQDGFPLLDPVYPFRTFRTSGGSGGGGSGTNRITSFSLGKAYYYEQVSAGAPTLDATSPYGFIASTILASNRTATQITLWLPNSTVSNLNAIPFAPENYSLMYFTANPTAVDSTFPPGDYMFAVMSTTNQSVTMNFPATTTMPQPNAPHVTNFTACQAINPAQAFTVGWDAFQNGTSVDYIHFSIGTNFSTPDPLSPGALTGTARTVQIPAGTLEPNTSYTASLGFYKMTFNTNDPAYNTTVWRGSITEFNITTTGTTGNNPLVLTNLSLTATNFRFEVTSAPSQAYTVEYSTTMLPGSWQALTSTNPPSGRTQFADPRAATNRYIFYRARTGL